MQIQPAPVPDVIYKLTEFEWAEFKDLAKQFLTLIVGVLVFSVTFSEKIVDYQDASKWQKASVVATWASLIAALLCAGLGVWWMYQASLSAMYDHRSLRAGSEPVGMLVAAYTTINLGGVFFALSLMAIVTTGLLTMFRESAGK